MFPTSSSTKMARCVGDFIPGSPGVHARGSVASARASGDCVRHASSLRPSPAPDASATPRRASRSNASEPIGSLASDRYQSDRSARSRSFARS